MEQARGMKSFGVEDAGNDDAEVDFVKMLQDSSSNPIPTFEFRDERGPPKIPGDLGAFSSGGMNIEALDNLLAETAELDLNTGLPARRGPPKLAAEDVISMVGKPSRRPPTALAQEPTGESVPISALLAETAPIDKTDSTEAAVPPANAPKTNKKGADLLGAISKVGVRQASQAVAILSQAISLRDQKVLAMLPQRRPKCRIHPSLWRWVLVA